MHVHFPKSLRGWREFAWEVFIIVIGVLIALSAEQLVERMTWRQRVNEAKEDLRSELNYDLFCAQERVRGKDCVDRKLARVSDLIDHPPPSTSKLRRVCPIRTWSSSTWDSAIASGAISHMSSDERARYAKIYSMVRSLHAANLDEFTTGTELGMLERGGPISDVTLDRLRAAVAKLRDFNSLIAVGAAQLCDWIHAAGIDLRADFSLKLKSSEECTMPDDPVPEH
ncbi:MAG: hypothetical protein M3O09_17775 [Acidobacteriota bacterium]|nr:hypothetical protein [Acidobacteriota bacterium]